MVHLNTTERRNKCYNSAGEIKCGMCYIYIYKLCKYRRESDYLSSTTPGKTSGKLCKAQSLSSTKTPKGL